MPKVPSESLMTGFGGVGLSGFRARGVYSVLGLGFGALGKVWGLGLLGFRVWGLWGVGPLRGLGFKA